MRSRQLTCFLPVILIFTLGAALPTPGQFAYQSELTPANQALQRVELSLDVLLASTRADLGDVTVFDAKGKPLPGWLRKVATPASQKKFGLPIYLFNTYRQNSSKTLTIREQNQDQDQFSESITTETIPIDQARPDYIIGLPETEAGLEIESIELTWTHEPADQLLQLRIDAGNDLDSWRTIRSNKSLTNQNSDDPKWRTIEAIPKGEKYLRLTPVNSIYSFELSQVIGTYRQKETERKIWHQLGKLHKTASQPGYFNFDMPSSVQATELRLIPGEQQTLISGDLHAGHEGFDKKRYMDSSIQQHNITNSEVEPSQSIKLPGQNYNHWWFKPSKDLGSAPEAEIAFPVYEILFLGNEDGPFTLAWGNYESDAPGNDLIKILSPDQQQSQSEQVQMGSVKVAGGKSRLMPQAELPWLKWFLWLILVVVVVTTGKMALSLYRDMNAG